MSTRVNFFNPYFQSINRHARKFIYFFIAVVILLFLLVSYYILLITQGQTAQTDLEVAQKAAQDSQLVQLLAKYQTQSNFENMYTNYEKRLQDLLLASQQADLISLDLLDIVSKSLPQGVALTNFNATSNTINLAGNSTSRLAVAVYIQNLKESQRFSQVKLASVQSADIQLGGTFTFSVGLVQNQPQGFPQEVIDMFKKNVMMLSGNLNQNGLTMKLLATKKQDILTLTNSLCRTLQYDKVTLSDIKMLDKDITQCVLTCQNASALLTEKDQITAILPTSMALAEYSHVGNDITFGLIGPDIKTVNTFVDRIIRSNIFTSVIHTQGQVSQNALATAWLQCTPKEQNKTLRDTVLMALIKNVKCVGYSQDGQTATLSLFATIKTDFDLAKSTLEKKKVFASLNLSSPVDTDGGYTANLTCSLMDTQNPLIKSILATVPQSMPIVSLGLSDHVVTLSLLPTTQADGMAVYNDLVNAQKSNLIHSQTSGDVTKAVPFDIRLELKEVPSP